MLRQHHEESFAAPDSDVRDGSSDLVSLIWMKSSGESPSDALREYVVVASRLDVPVEFVLVNNGGPESELADEVRIVAAADMPVTVVHLHGRSPDSVALSAACRAAKGDRIATLPYYLQVSATKLSEMIERSRTEFDFVASVRVARVDGKSGQAKSWWFNRAVRWISGIELRDLNSGLKVFHRSVVDGVPIYGELHVYLPILAAKQGFRVGEVEVNHLEERQATAGYGIYLRRALDLLTVFFLVRFTQRPFRFFGSIGE